MRPCIGGTLLLVQLPCGRRHVAAAVIAAPVGVKCGRSSAAAARVTRSVTDVTPDIGLARGYAMIV